MLSHLYAISFSSYPVHHMYFAFFFSFPISFVELIFISFSLSSHNRCAFPFILNGSLLSHSFVSHPVCPV